MIPIEVTAQENHEWINDHELCAFIKERVHQFEQQFKGIGLELAKVKVDIIDKGADRKRVYVDFTAVGMILDRADPSVGGDVAEPSGAVGVDTKEGQTLGPGADRLDDEGGFARTRGAG